MTPEFIHRHVPPQGSGDDLTLLLLHGTGGTEDDLIGVGQMLAPEARLLSPRGKVLENGMPRFFRRLAAGVFDEEDVRRRSHELADFVEGAAAEYGFSQARTLAVGYSNGANIAGGVLLLRPEVLRGAILFKPMVPLKLDTTPDLAGKPVLICAGKRDGMVPPSETERLIALLEQAGAEVAVHWYDGGHELSRAELARATEWLASL